MLGRSLPWRLVSAITRLHPLPTEGPEYREAPPHVQALQTLYAPFSGNLWRGGIADVDAVDQDARSKGILTSNPNPADGANTASLCCGNSNLRSK